MTLTVTVHDNETGTTDTVEVMDDDYFLICTGTCHEAGVQVYPTSGTHVLTIKGQRARRLKREAYVPLISLLALAAVISFVWASAV